MSSRLMDPAALRIIHYPHPTLRRASKAIKRVDGELVSLVHRMVKLMHEADGLGLAANQVNLPFRLFVANLKSVTNEDADLVFINPVISRPKGRAEMSEGCLSFPELYAPVTRAKQVHIQAFTLEGKEINTVLEGLAARVVQHETDHLDGIVFPDRMTPEAQRDIEAELDEFRLEFESERRNGKIPDDQELEAQLIEWENRYC